MGSSISSQPVSTVLVNGKPMKFEGNFGFKINNQEYSARNGKVYNSNNTEIKQLRMPEYMAEHFFGMSGMDFEYGTFNASDISSAEALQKEDGSVQGEPHIDLRLKGNTGDKGKLQVGYTGVIDGVFSSQYKSNETGRVSTISIWLNK